MIVEDGGESYAKQEERIRELYDTVIDSVFSYAKKLEAEGYEGDTHMYALTIHMSVAATFSKHMGDYIKEKGGELTEMSSNKGDA